MASIKVPKKRRFFTAPVITIIGICVAAYAAIVYPMMNIEKYRASQSYNRRNIKQEDIQPGNMRVWSDPFGRK